MNSTELSVEYIYDWRFIFCVLLAGFVGQIAFEAYAWIASPLLFGVTLEPANLVAAITAKLTGAPLPYAPAFLVHFLIGSIGFILPIVAMRCFLGLGYVWAGALVGLALWFIAQGMLAPFIGRSFMMGFGAYTQSSLIAHVGMCMVSGGVLDRLLSARMTPAKPAAAR